MKEDFCIAVRLPDQDLDWDFIGIMEYTEAYKEFGAACLEHSCHTGAIVELIKMDPDADATGEHFIPIISVKMLDKDAPHDMYSDPEGKTLGQAETDALFDSGGVFAEGEPNDTQ